MLHGLNQLKDHLPVALEYNQNLTSRILLENTFFCDRYDYLKSLLERLNPKHENIKNYMVVKDGDVCKMKYTPPCTHVCRCRSGRWTPPL